MKEFLGIGGYTRVPEGAYSWQHLTFVFVLMGLMIFLAVFFGLRYRNKDDKTKNKVIIAAAILIDAIEIFKLIVICVRGNGISELRVNLPLFLCSIQLIALPLAAFTKGRVKEAAKDFVFIFGILGGLMGIIGAAQNFNAYPVISLDNMASGLTHSIAGFASLYIGVSGSASMKKKNIPFTYGILLFFMVLAFIANTVLDYNYMFLVRPDGTPYQIFYNLVGGNPIIYPMIVIGLFLAYIAVFYLIFLAIRKKRLHKEAISG